MITKAALFYEDVQKEVSVYERPKRREAPHLKSANETWEWRQRCGAKQRHQFLFYSRRVAHWFFYSDKKLWSWNWPSLLSVKSNPIREINLCPARTRFTQIPRACVEMSRRGCVWESRTSLVSVFTARDLWIICFWQERLDVQLPMPNILIAFPIILHYGSHWKSNLPALKKHTLLPKNQLGYFWLFSSCWNFLLHIINIFFKTIRNCSALCIYIFTV